jgi:hypothetical protein
MGDFSIGLQVFSKLGGIPWTVKPSTNNCFIFGCRKAHDIQRQNGRTTVKKYFAYSVALINGVIDLWGVMRHNESGGILR